MNKNLGLVSLFATALLFYAACGDDGDDKVAVDATTNPSIDGGGGLIDGSVQTVDAMPSPDATPAPDAMPSALDCAGDALPTTVANPPIVIAGPIQEATLNGVGTLAASTHVSANNYSDDTVIVEDDFTGGTFTVTDPNASTTPLNAYVKATVSGYLDTYIFPGAPIAESIPNAPLIMLSDSIFGLIGLLTGITTIQGTGTLTAAVLDCNNDPISGAVVTITPNVGTIKYADAMGLPGSADFPSTQGAGVVYIFNVPPGEYTISSSVGGTDLRDNTVKSFADSISTIQVIP